MQSKNMEYIKVILDAIIGACKDRRDISTLFIIMLFILTFTFYKYLEANSFVICIEYVSVIVMVIVTIILILSVIICALILNYKTLFSRIEASLAASSTNIVTLLDAVSQSLQSSIVQTNDIMMLCKKMNSNSRVDCELMKTNLEMIHLRCQNIVFKCLRILVNYNRDLDVEVNKGVKLSIAKMAALQNANESLKLMKQSFIDDLYKSCTNLSTIIKDDLLQFLESQNLKIKEVLDDDNMECDEKVSTILMLTSTLSDSIFTLCHRHIFPSVDDYEERD